MIGTHLGAQADHGVKSLVQVLLLRLHREGRREQRRHVRCLLLHPQREGCGGKRRRPGCTISYTTPAPPWAWAAHSQYYRICPPAAATTNNNTTHTHAPHHPAR